MLLFARWEPVCNLQLAVCKNLKTEIFHRQPTMKTANYNF
jgi:hypothetical protein